MKLRAFWIVSFVLAIIAIGIHVKSLNVASKGMKAMAKAVTATDNQIEILRTEAKRFANLSGTIAITGLGVAIGSLVCVVVSFKKHEPAWRSIPFALLVFYVLLQFAVV
jgi:hypothetical protein